MQRWTKGLLAVWLMMLTAAQTGAFLLTWRFFIHTESGQKLDTIALTANKIGQDEVQRIVNTVLNAMSLASLAVATAVIGFIAVIRSRFLLAFVATLVIGGSNLTSQAIKYFTVRPDLGVDPERAAVGNSLPSGHTTVAAAVAVALVLVLPRQLRALGALIATAYAGIAGVATLSAGWHRPSDAVAAFLIVGAWASFGGLLLAVNQRRAEASPTQAGHRWAVLTLILTSILLLALALGSLWLTDQVLEIPADDLSRRRLMVAYGGSAAGIAGTACLVIGLVLASVPWVVPARAPNGVAARESET